MNKYRTNDQLILTNKEEKIFKKFINKELPFAWTTTLAYTKQDSPDTVLTSTNVKFSDDVSRVTKITIKNAVGNEIYTDEEYLLKNSNGDEKFLNIDIGCFDNFFAVIHHFEDKVKGEKNINVALTAYDYEGSLIGHFEPEASMFAYYTKNQLAKLASKVFDKMIIDSTEKEQ